MNKILLYSSNEIYAIKQTGGVKRFLELVNFAVDKTNIDLCCQNSTEMPVNGKTVKFVIKKAHNSWLHIFPPEMRILLSNINVIKKIKRENYDSVIVFDVPPAIGLCLMGVKNIDLMIRKDLIGYEKIKLKHKNRFSSILKLSYMWMSEAICISKAKHIVCQCEYDKKRILDRHRWIRKRIENRFIIQMNNVNPSWIVSKSKISANSATSQEIFRVCYIGDFDDERKGYKLILEASRILLTQGKNIHFEIIGSGKELDECKKKYECDNIHFYGRLENPISVLKNCNLAVVPSLADSCPNTVMEAIYNDIPVIGSTAGGIPEILNNEMALFELESNSIAERISMLCSDFVLMEELLVKQKVRKKQLLFDWAPQIISLLER